MAIAYGVYGVPETFFISPDGTIVDKYVGPLNASALQTAGREGGRLQRRLAGEKRTPPRGHAGRDTRRAGPRAGRRLDEPRPGRRPDARSRAGRGERGPRRGPSPRGSPRRGRARRRGQARRPAPALPRLPGPVRRGVALGQWPRTCGPRCASWWPRATTRSRSSGTSSAPTASSCAGAAHARRQLDRVAGARRGPARRRPDRELVLRRPRGRLRRLPRLPRRSCPARKPARPRPLRRRTLFQRILSSRRTCSACASWPMGWPGGVRPGAKRS